MTMSAAVGFFGKLPGSGDFVQRGLAPAFVDAWDRHFERAVQASREQLGERWPAAYRGAPVWRFVLAPGVCGDAVWAGVMGPSTDRVGRGFPMVMAAPFAGEPACAVRGLNGNEWFDALEVLFREAQADDGMGAETLQARLSSVLRPADVAVTTISARLGDIDWSNGDRWRMPRLADGQFLAEAWPQLATRSDPYCLWWTLGAGQVPASFVVTLGLPHPSTYAGFLDTGVVGDPAPVLPDAPRPHSGHVLVRPHEDGVLILVGPAGVLEPIAEQWTDGRMTTLCESLCALYPRLPEDGAVIVAKVTAGRATVLRVGAAVAWHWRHGELRCLYTMPAGSTDNEVCIPPHCVEASCELEAGDRLLLLGTRALAALPPERIAHALAAATSEEARDQIAAMACLGPVLARWPLTVIEIES